MKKLAGILTTVLFAVFLPGCSHAAMPKSAKNVSSGVPGRRPPASSAVPAFGLQGNENVGLAGKNNHFELRSLDFLNDETGWVIQDRYKSVADADASQLLSTKDGGKSWHPIGTDGRTLSAVCFTSETEGWAVSEDNGGSIARSADTLKKYQVLHTKDGGASWEIQWQSGLWPNSEPALYFQSGKDGYALAGASLLKTQNGGGTWSAVEFGQQDFAPCRIFFTDASSGWVAGVSEKKTVFTLLHTFDGGKSWSLQFRKKYEAENSLGCVGIDFLNEKEGWFLPSTTGDDGLYRTVDGGANWKLAGKIRGIRPDPEGLCFIDPKTGWIPLDMGAGPIDGGLCYTRDGGKSFQTVGDTLDGRPRKINGVRQILFLSKKNGWAVGECHDRGDYLLRTGDGGNTWEQIYPKPEPVDDFSFVDGNKGFGLGKLSDENALMKTTDGGENWETMKSFDFPVDKVSFISPQEGWIVSLDIMNKPSIVLHTSDGGRTWTKAGTFSACAPTLSDFRFFDEKHGAMIIRDMKDLIYRTSDGGKTWSSSPWNFGDNVMSAQVEMSGLSGDRTQWINTPLGLGGNAAALLPGGKGMVLTGTDGRFMMLTTSDGGGTWNQHLFPKGLDEDTFEDSLNKCKMQFADSANGWILTDYGLLATVDGGRSWVWK